MRTVLVTGGAGFIGSHIATALVDRGERVRVLDNLSTGRLQNLAHLEGKIEWLQADLNDRAAVGEAVKDVDCVFHQAALASVPRSVVDPMATHESCVTGTVTLLDKARKAGVRRVIYAGSSSAYGNQPHAAKRETDLPAPLSPYASAKLAGEYYCHAFGACYGLETVCIRYFNVFGPRQDPDSPYAAVIPLFVNAMLAGKQPVIFGDGRQSRDFTYIDNVVHGNLLAADAKDAVGRTINVACGRQTSLLELIDVLNRLLETKIQPVHDSPRAGDVRDSLADISLARKLLCYEPLVDFRVGLARSIDYYRLTGKP
jgi:UDP-glucose 4-epimerase